MKRVISIAVLTAILLIFLCACSVDLNLTAEAEPYIKEMLMALSENNQDAASELLHPSVRDNTGLVEMAAYLAGRKVVSCTQLGINMSGGVGAAGTVKTESGTVEITMENGTSLHLTYTYEINADGSGFTGFRISLGI